MTSPPARTLGAILYPDFELLDLYGPLEMFGSVGPELRIVTVAETKGPVASAQGPETLARSDFASAPPLGFCCPAASVRCRSSATRRCTRSCAADRGRRMRRCRCARTRRS